MLHEIHNVQAYHCLRQSVRKVSAWNFCPTKFSSDLISLNLLATLYICTHWMHVNIYTMNYFITGEGPVQSGECWVSNVMVNLALIVNFTSTIDQHLSNTILRTNQGYDQLAIGTRDDGVP